MTTRIICLGNSTLDKVWPLAELPTTYGKYRATDYLELGGGMAANAAVAAARLGGNVAYWGRGGDDAAGFAMKNEMAGYGVDTANFRLFEGARSSVSAVLVAQDGERMIINFRGTGLPDDADWLPLDQLHGTAAVLADIRWVNGACAIFSAARTAGIPTILDGEIADETAFATVLPVTDHAIFSEPGLRAFAHNPNLNSDADYIAVLEKVRTLGCRVAAVTRGARGIVWLSETGMHQQPAFTVNVVDTTGAGDVFHGAYSLALGEGKSVPDAMRFASATAALKCTKHGGRAGIPDHEQVLNFLANQK